MTHSPTAHPRRRRSAAALIAGVCAMGLGLSACGSSDSAGGASGSSSGAGSSKVSGTVTVFAAASLKEAFTALGTQFEKEHPGTSVRFSFGPSSGLAQQLTQGAPADVFASASVKNMDQAVSGKAVNTPSTFAKNTLIIVTPPNNPGKVTGLNSLTSSSVKTALCQEQVPCGTVSKKVLEKAKLDVKPVTREVDVKAVLTKVRLGEVDAGLVYVSDAKTAGSAVNAIQIPAADNASTDYPIATTTSSKNTAAADAFVALVKSDAGRKELSASGFAAP